MAWYDRDYNREEFSRGGGGFGRRLGGGFAGGVGGGRSLVMTLLIVCIAVFVLDGLLYGASRFNAFTLTSLGAFSIEDAFMRFQIWRPITYIFLHGGFWHLLGNMIVLYFFGPMMEQWWGSRRFLAFFIICGLGGAVLFTIMALTRVLDLSIDSQLVGASGSIYGILIGCATAAPNQTFRFLLLPFEMRLRTLAWIVLSLAILSVLLATPDAPGQAAHLGGAVLGYLLVKFPRSLDWADRVASPRVKQRVQSMQADRRRAQNEKLEEEVDRILAKVKDKGLHSLTRGEKRTLEKARQR